MKRKAIGYQGGASKYARFARAAIRTFAGAAGAYVRPRADAAINRALDQASQRIAKKFEYVKPLSVSKFTSTKGGSVKSGGKTGPGRSGGFYKTRRKVTRKSVKKVSGYTFTGEYGGIGTSPNVGVIGHISAPIATVKRTAWGAVTKMLMEKAGVPLVKSGSVLTEVLPGDVLSVQYQVNETIASTQQSYTFVGAETLEDVIDWLTDSARSYFPNTSVADQIRFTNIIFAPIAVDGFVRALHSVTICLDRVTIKMQTKSSLKLQNRTIVATGDDDNDVNNQPIYGKGYSGPGTAAEWREVYPASFAGHGTYGIITGDDETAPSLEDIPDPATFKWVTRTGKMKLEPGEIRTSVLSSNMRVDFNSLMRTIQPNGFNITDKVRKKLGKYRFFIYEKMLDTGAEYNIVLAFEHNINFFTTMSEGRRPVMIKEFSEEKNLVF